ncbi:MAG: peptidylprolyl isomerase [Spirochaetia bacterium]
MNISSITINTGSSDAEEIYRQAAEGVSSFEELARIHSADIFAEQGGEMGWEFYYDLEPDFDDIAQLDEVFSLRAGEISPVLQTRTGYVIYRVNEPAQEPNFDDPATIQVVRDYMETFARGQIEDYAYDRAQSFAETAQEQGFSAAAEQNSISVGRTEFFPLNHGDVPLFETPRAAEGADLDDAVNREGFFRTAFSITADETSSPLVLENKVIVLSLDDERTVSSATLDTIENFWGNYLQNFQQQDLQRTLMNPDYLEDNFNEVFVNRILG